MNTVRSILKRYGVVPKRSLGQSFLTEARVAEEIVSLADIKRGDTLVEIGSGVGLMTRLIAAKAEKVIALEIDPSLYAILGEELKGEPNIEVIKMDVLKYDFNSALGDDPGKKIKVIGNIPYYISSPILFHLLDFREKITSMVIMVQKEVALRLVAPPNTRAYGIPTVIISMYAEISHALMVSPQSFYPAPKVTSCVLDIQFREKPLLELADHDFFRKVVKTAFAMRRKTLLNNLRSLTKIGLSEEIITETLAKVGIDGRRRAETLRVEEFGHLSNALFGRLEKWQLLSLPTSSSYNYRNYSGS